MKKSIKITIMAYAIVLFQSCMVTRTTIGDGPVAKKGKTEVYSKTKQLYIFWGLFPLGHSQPAIPTHNNVQIKTSRNLGDALIGMLTLGIVQSQSIRVLVKKEEKIKETTESK